MEKILKWKISLIIFLKISTSINFRPVLMPIVTQEKRPGVNIWPNIGVIKNSKWVQLSETYGIYEMTSYDHHFPNFFKNFAVFWPKFWGLTP